ncbi:glycoside hydrolase family 2 protein [Aquimarina sp. AD10]|uniref:beta-mannosidase n=1 Tax=Aquimarina sp. AD10 TaxID=1714849 RepID=UPI000E491DCD|nr:glycoside hydrolase family 2 protein [Aquimarina sp. AD10]AXT61737.1 glycoside hydrolase family 2 protein [Aquimarina sp. AD10]RKN00912.1 glycoside hydrolase family 2 protein [Aquimarina sp. AD10]
MKNNVDYFKLLLFIIVIFLSGCGIDSSVSEINLQQNWDFKTSKDTQWHAATVPGTVHTDLIDLGIIKDPYYRLNEHDLQWIDKEDWEYKTNFELSKTDLRKQHISLDFLGLDTYSKIYLNDSLVMQTDNMFRTYSASIKPLLKVGSNKLHIIFDSPIQRGIQKYDSLGYKIPVSDNDLSKIGKVTDEKQVSIYTRKAGYHFGWDWGPRLVTSGIWRPIILKSWNHHKINDLFIQQNNIGQKAQLTAQIEVEADKDNDNAIVALHLNQGQQPIKTVELKLNKGINHLKIPFEIDNPKLWWPNGMGDQILYSIEAKVTANSYMDSKSHRIGLRTIELIREKDSIGASFYFKVNGHPVFMKGANYIPQDVFLTRAKSENYKHILSSAKEANMNMLRVWGGGIYENDEFYELCDEMGLLVWQDFMFACAMFPGDASFLENVKQEAIDNVKRLRNHTSIALWCGNNEILSAWENWGWKNKVIEEQSQEVANTIWNAYDDIFHKVLPEVVDAYDPSRTYWPSSPGSDFGEKESFEKGDAHYWLVWWGKQPFDNYNTAIPRFMSEYGFQSFPELSTVEKYTLPEDHDVYSEVMKSHQRSSIGNETIEEYMLRHYQKPKDFASFLYVSQLLQAHGIKVGIEAHRRNRDRCMGSLYWQINDCWPVASWSSIDYYGKWKALHYTAKKSFENILISFENKKDNLDVFVVSDSLKNINAQLEIRLLDFDGNELKQWQKQVVIDQNQSKKYFELLKSEFIKEASQDNVFFHAQLIANEKTIAENTFYLKPYKSLNFPKPDLTYSISEDDSHFIVSLVTKKIAKDVFISSGSDQNFTDNYFDMLPNMQKTIRIKKTNAETLNTFKKKLKVITLFDSYTN